MKIHFIGIGGIGTSALAQYYLSKGHKVTGSDLVSSEITKSLNKKGAKLLLGQHKAENISKSIDLVVYSPAVKPDNPEFKEVKKRKIKIQSYPQALGDLTKQYFTIAVSGTHGKSTTSAMISLLLIKAGLDPTVIIGTKMKELGNSTRSTGSGLILNHTEGSNYRVGKSKFLLIEADEHFASFLNYRPKIIILTNIEADHLDFYKNFGNVLKAFKKYISRLPKDGILVANKDDRNIRKILNKRMKVKKYSLKQPEAVQIKKALKVPGEHNIYNGLAVLTLARILKIPDEITFKAISSYKSCWRRFEIIKVPDPKPYTLISDYGHHPTEVEATLEAARQKYPKKEIWCIFQPHQYQRTYYLFDDFVDVLKNAPIDKLLITDVYDVAGREEKKIKDKVNSAKLVQKINESWVDYLPKEKIVKYVKKNIKGGEVVIIMGAGDIYNITVQLAPTSNKD